MVCCMTEFRCSSPKHNIPAVPGKSMSISYLKRRSRSGQVDGSSISRKRLREWLGCLVVGF